MLKTFRMKFSKYILVLFLLTSCERGYKLTELYSQKIENTDKIIFEYKAWSNFNDGSKYGKTILDKSESIIISDAGKFPFTFFIGNPTKDTLFVFELKEGGTRIPKYISTEISKFNGVTVKTDYYSYEIGSSHNLTYKFSTFEETKDSLIIYGLEKEYFNIPTSKNEIGFYKGNIKLVESDSLKGFVKQIEIPAFLLKNYNTTSIDKVTIIRNDSLELNGLVHFTFIPKTPIRSTEFSDFGIYKKYSIKDVKKIQ
jgi:hypothetical protein